MAYPTSSNELFNRNMYVDHRTEFESFYSKCVMDKKIGVKEGKEEAADSLFLNMRGFLILGRIAGVIPLSGVINSHQADLHYKFFSIPAILNLAITSLVGFTSVLAVIETIGLPKFNALEIARSIQGTVFKLWGLFCYIYFLVRANLFVKIFKAWGDCSLFNNVKDKSLRRDIIILSLIIFTGAIAESILIHLEYFPCFDYINGESSYLNTTLNTTLETYYLRSHSYWQKFLGYHPVLAIIAFVSHKFVVVCWNYVDLTLIIFARALYFKFKGLCEVATDSLQASKKVAGVTPFSLADRLIWIHIVNDHDALCTLLESFETFLSPLIFGSYSTNIYYVCMQLIDSLTPETVDHSLVHAIFAPVSFMLVILRIFLLSITAARINTYAHEIGSILKKCPIELYSEEVQRIDKHVTAGPDIGLSGLGCFIVTKPFLLNILNVIFTVEIVLLQGVVTVSTPGACNASQ